MEITKNSAIYFYFFRLIPGSAQKNPLLAARKNFIKYAALDLLNEKNECKSGRWFPFSGGFSMQILIKQRGRLF